ncbi:MAG: hypothetical protein AB7O24_14835 [Kofleriaceae bacterium]
MRLRVSIVTLSVVLWAAQVEARPSKAWRVAKSQVPATTTTVVGVDAVAWTKSSMFTPFYELAEKKRPEMKDGRAKLLAECQVDLVSAIDSIVVAGEDGDAAGAVYLSIAGSDAKKLEVCVSKRSGGDTAVRIKRSGPIVEITEADSTTYMGWINNVLVVPFDRSSEQELKKWMGGRRGFSKSALKAVLDRVDTSAALWMASTSEQTTADGTVKRAVATIKLSSNNVVTDARVMMADATQAASMASQINSQLGGMGALGSANPAAGRVLKNLTVQASDAELVVHSTASQRDVVSLVTAFGPMLAH